jgi:hypothetical protein
MCRILEFSIKIIEDVNLIYLERRRELAFEGFGIHDEKRFNVL